MHFLFPAFLIKNLVHSPVYSTYGEGYAMLIGYQAYLPIIANLVFSGNGGTVAWPLTACIELTAIALSRPTMKRGKYITVISTKY